MSANLVTSPTPPADLSFQVALVPREKRGHILLYSI